MKQRNQTHTLSPSRRLNSESQTHWSSGLTLSLKKKVKIQNIEFLQMSNAFQLLSSYFRLFAWQHVLCCITEFLQQKNVHSVLQSFLLFFRMCHSCKPVSHPVIHIIGLAILFVFTCLKRLRCQYKTKKSL